MLSIEANHHNGDICYYYFSSLNIFCTKQVGNSLIIYCAKQNPILQINLDNIAEIYIGCDVKEVNRDILKEIQQIFHQAVFDIENSIRIKLKEKKEC